ncbi:ribosome maturation factor RimP [Vulcanibacillus modesticaldus]|uniref:Ribosome maturation factor RimP n=1 Tax=Vulcanibacillus modesticaldus TaxID=337097 RepID=A0A1D2YXN4_9BACI|nr:ribosome maturation factor RimP [Vulcanibacillus modesticaldus]OEG00439.1 ribosome maturation factor RimP [Vulcanibacillus modesticaldus]
MSKRITEIVEKMALPILEEQNLELVDIEYKKEGSNWFLRVYIDKENGSVDIEDCGRVSEALSIELDKVDPISNPYFLEVSSPGAERPLKNEKDLLKAVGKHVHITTYEPINDQKIFEGELVNFVQNTLTIITDEKEIKIPYEKVASARLALVL